MLDTDRVLTLTLEPVGACTLACRYCYAHATTHLPPCAPDMFYDTLRESVEYAERIGVNKVDCLWLGGEPLLAGSAFFEALASFTSALSRSVRVRHFVQTNGLLLDAAYCRLFRDANIRVGVSLDGPQDIHDAFRVAHDGSPTHARVMEKIGLLREHETPFGCVAVCTRETLGREREVYEFFHSLGVGFRINPVIPNGNGDDTAYRITPEEYGQSLVRLFDAWVAPADNFVNVSPLDIYLQAVLKGTSAGCQHRGFCDTLGIKPNGDATVCGRFQQGILGNVKQGHAGDILRACMPETTCVRAPHTECRACANWAVCHGGCPHNAVAFGADAAAKDPFCSAYKQIFAHIRNALHP